VFLKLKRKTLSNILYNIKASIQTRGIMYYSSSSSSSQFSKVFINLLQIQITLFFPEIVHNNYMGIYKMNHRITKCINSGMVEFNRGS